MHGHCLHDLQLHGPWWAAPSCIAGAETGMLAAHTIASGGHCMPVLQLHEAWRAVNTAAKFVKSCKKRVGEA